MAGLTRVGDIWIIDRINRQQGCKHVAVNVAGLGTLDNSRHVAAHTVGKRVNGVGRCLIQDRMTFKALLGACSDSLGTGGRQADLVDVVARGARHSLPIMLRLLPVNVLLMMPFGKLIGIDVLDVALGKRGRSVISFK